jgi:hypothetical protein
VGQVPQIKLFKGRTRHKLLKGLFSLIWFVYIHLWTYTDAVRSRAPLYIHALPPAFTLVSSSRLIRPWRWRRNIPPKRQLTFNGLHGVITQKIVFFMKITVFRVVIPCNSERNQCCGGIYRLRLQCRWENQTGNRQKQAESLLGSCLAHSSIAKMAAMFLRNVGLPPNYTVLQPGRLQQYTLRFINSGYMCITETSSTFHVIIWVKCRNIWSIHTNSTVIS